MAGALVAALALQMGVNFANDVADAARGADTEERVGPARAVASGLIGPHDMWRGVGVAFAVAALAGVYLAVIAGPLVLLIGASSFLAALGYTNGPLPYGYRGLGELFVFVFFGLVATVGTRFVFDGTAPARAWVAGAVMGMLAAAILVANNIRDVDTDRKAGKRTLAVIVGRDATRLLYGVLVIGAFAVVVVGSVLGPFRAGALLALAAAPLSVGPIRAVASPSDPETLVRALSRTARLQMATGALLGLGTLI